MKFNSKGVMTGCSILVATVNGRAAANASLCSGRNVIVDQAKSRANTDFCGYFFTPSRGLACSRNIGLSLCGTEFALIADDDVVHYSGVLGIIEEEFFRTGADIITFQIKTPSDLFFKDYSNRRRKHTLRSLMRVSSIEIAVRMSAVRKHGLKFDERFGLGSCYPTGEEIIFLADALKAGLDLRYAPIPIVIHPPESSGSNLFRNDRLLMSKGAMFARVFGRLGYFACAAFVIKHYKKTGYGIWSCLRIVINGCHHFLLGNRP